METESKPRLADVFVGIRDPRQAKKVNHDLVELLVVAVCGVLAGADDFILHVAARDTAHLRAFVVEHLNADADVAGTQTSLIFEHLRGASPL